MENLFKLVNRMSIVEGLSENLEEQDAEKAQDIFATYNAHLIIEGPTAYLE